MLWNRMSKKRKKNKERSGTKKLKNWRIEKQTAIKIEGPKEQKIILGYTKSQKLETSKEIKKKKNQLII